MVGNISPATRIADSFYQEANLYKGVEQGIGAYYSSANGFTRNSPTQILAKLATYPTEFNSLRLQRSLDEKQLKNEQKDLKFVMNLIGTA